MKELEELKEHKKRKIAFEIIYYSKRLVLCAIFFYIYYFIIYNKYVASIIYNYPVYQKKWFFEEHIEYHNFLLSIFNAIFIITVILILFHRQIISAYLWLKKYSKQN